MFRKLFFVSFVITKTKIFKLLLFGYQISCFLVFAVASLGPQEGERQKHLIIKGENATDKRRIEINCIIDVGP